MTELERLLIQIEENRHRKDWTAGEVFEAGKKLEALMATPRGRPKKGESCPRFGKGKTREKVAEVLDVSGRQYDKIKDIYESPFDDLKDELERHGKVERVHKWLVRRQAADKIAKLVGTVPLQKVVCTDCLDYLRGITKPMSHASVYDPPFGIGYKYQGFVDPDNPKDYWEWFRPRYEEIRRVTLPGGAIIFWQAESYRRYFFDWYGDHHLFYAIKRNGCPWQSHKGRLSAVVDPIIFQWKEGAPPLLPSVQDWSYDYWISDLTFSDGLIHPCPRPMDLCEVIVRNWTVENGIILDAFTGSGQIPLAVVKVGGGRKFVAIEVVPEYAAEAERRLIEATGG
jgi:hypothetical protein